VLRCKWRDCFVINAGLSDGSLIVITTDAKPKPLRYHSFDCLRAAMMMLGIY